MMKMRRPGKKVQRNLLYVAVAVPSYLRIVLDALMIYVSVVFYKKKKRMFI
jgi:hypothetical protein